jgi:hypothetical protein
MLPILIVFIYSAGLPSFYEMPFDYPDKAFWLSMKGLLTNSLDGGPCYEAISMIPFDETKLPLGPYSDVIVLGIKGNAT